MGAPQEMLHIDQGRPGEPLQCSAGPSAPPGQGPQGPPMGGHYHHPPLISHHGMFQYVPSITPRSAYVSIDPRLPPPNAPKQSTPQPKNNWVLLEAEMRVEAIQTLIAKELVPKRKALVLQGQKIAERRAKIVSAFEEAAAKVSAQADKQLRVLREVRDVRLTTLEVDAKEVTTKLDEMRHVISETSVVCNAYAGPDSLPKLNALEDKAWAICQQAVEPEPGAAEDEINAPLSDYDDLLDRHRSLAKLVQVKDEMIERLLKERSEMREQLALKAEGDRRCPSPGPQPANGNASHQALEVTLNPNTISLEFQ